VLYDTTLQLDTDGRAVVPEAPGWGVSFDEGAMKRYASDR
jgi:L-alanine-DL-glutamate epimerase-like enolase superfamily enzyme